jgi:hypothetical protein
MSILGKILAFLNILGMVALLTFGLLDYAKRRTWEYAVIRHDLAINGLPVHKEETDDEGRIVYLLYTEQTKKELFPSNPVVTQKEEVERVQKAMQAKTSAVTDPQQQSVLYATLLLPFAQTNAQREKLLAIRDHLANEQTVKQLQQDLDKVWNQTKAAKAGNPVELEFANHLHALRGEPRGPLADTFLDEMKKNPNKTTDDAFKDTLAAVNADLKSQFDGLFNEALQGQRAGGSKMSQDERRDAISTLLFNLVDAEAADAAANAPGTAELYQNPGYKRYLSVVGLEKAARTMNQQATKLNSIASDLEEERNREREAFVNTSLLPLINQAKQSALNAERLADDLKRADAKVTEQQVLVNQRKKNVEDATNELTAYRTATAQKLADLRAMSNEVYNVRLKVRDATVINQEHERTIRSLEGWRWLPFVGGQFLINREER